MFDEKAVIAQVHQGSYPSNWCVYYGEPRWWKIYVIGVVSLALGLFGLPFGGIGLFIIVFGAIFAHIAWINAKERSHSVLVILPEGAAYCRRGADYGRLVFAGINNMRLASQVQIDEDTSKTYYWLDIFTNTGQYFRWSFEDFVDPVLLSNTIIAAYGAYIH